MVTDYGVILCVDSADDHHYSHLFSSQLGSTVLTQSLQQLIGLRFQFVRDLAVLLSVIYNLKDDVGVYVFLTTILAVYDYKSGKSGFEPVFFYISAPWLISKHSYLWN